MAARSSAEFGHTSPVRTHSPRVRTSLIRALEPRAARGLVCPDVAVVTGQRLSELISCESDRTSASGIETFGRFPDSLRNSKPHSGHRPLCGLPMSGLRAADGAISIPCSADRSWSIRPSSSLRFRRRRRNRCPKRRSLKEPCTKRSRQRCRRLAGDRSPSAC